MQNLDEDINTALTMLEKGYLDIDKLKKYDEVYLKTNENLGAYFKYFPIKDGVISTVIGSGDHILQAIKDAPKEIHAFDKNIFTIYLAKLKLASCQALNFKQFEEYYNFCCEKFLCEDYYKIIREFLDNDSKCFWDAVYVKGNILKKHNVFFINMINSTNNESNSYENEKNYIKVKKNISKVMIKYYPYEFFKMFKNINGNQKFDAIFLSNICDWYESSRQKKEFLNYVKKELTKQLSDNGMVAAYCVPEYARRKNFIFEKKIYKLESTGVIVYKKKL